MNASCTSAATIAVPSDVQRCPAVPNPLKRAPSTARSRSASGITTSGFFPPSSRHGVCRCRPASSPIREPTTLDPVKPIFAIRPSSRERSSPANVAAPSVSTMWNASGGTPACRISWANASAIAGVYSAGFHTTVLPHSSAGTMYQEGTATGKFPAVTIADGPDGHAEREQLLVRQLARHGHPVEASSLRLEERAGVDHLLDLATRLRDRLADLAGDQSGQRLLVRGDELAEPLDRLPTHRRGDGRPPWLCARGRAGRLDERRRVAERYLGDLLAEVGGVRDRCGGRPARPLRRCLRIKELTRCMGAMLRRRH